MTHHLLYINFRRLLPESICAFQAAHQSGYKVSLMGQKLPKTLLPYVDTYVECDISNEEEFFKSAESLFQRSHIAAIVCFTESAVEACAALAKKKNLPGLAMDAAFNARNKDRLREATYPIDQWRTSVLKTHDDLIEFLKNPSFPVVIKPTNASGSDGVHTMKTKQDLRQFANSSSCNDLFHDGSRSLIAERYIQGQEVSVEGFVQHGHVTIVGITEKTTLSPHNLEIQHIFPSPVSEKQKSFIEKQSKKYINALKFDNTSFHLEGKYDEDSFVLIEVAARPGGDYIASHLVPLATGYNFYKNLNQVALGFEAEDVGKNDCVSGIRFIMAHDEGVLKGFQGMEEVLMHPWVEHVMVEQSIGTHIVLPPKNFRLQRLVGVISRAPSYQDMTEHMKWIEETLSPIIESKNH